MIMKILLAALASLTIAGAAHHTSVSMQISRSWSIDSLGACQGVARLDDRLFLYGDREIGMIREYQLNKDSLVWLGKEYRLTVNGSDVINHPTGIAYRKGMPTFIGNSIRLNPEGTQWKAVIYSVNWAGLLKTGTLDGNLLNTIDDDACVQGTRPEYIQYKKKWYVATADYGGKANEVRLYDPALLHKARKTSAPGVVVKKFTCSPWVQNLHWIPGKNILVLIQNQVEGRKWRFTFLDFEKSMAAGTEQVIKVVDLNERPDELEGFTFLDNMTEGIAVSSSRKQNANKMMISWEK